MMRACSTMGMPSLGLHATPLPFKTHLSTTWKWKWTCSSLPSSNDGTLGRRDFLQALSSSLIPSSSALLPKQSHLTIQSVKEIIEDDFTQRRYYVTGNLTRSIYEERCRFIDPTTSIDGVDKYIAGIKLLFDPSQSELNLLSIAITGPQTIQANWKLSGYLNLPWHPYVEPYEGSTRYTLNMDGLVSSHEETWSISVWKAFQELLTPSWKSF